MSETTRWWWIRHAPVKSNGVIYGRNDLPCDCTDEPVFRNLAQTLPEDAIWVVTHLQRTRQTADAILSARPAPPELPVQPLVEPDLAEQHFGDWQGLTVEQVERERGNAWHRFWLAPAHETAPNGESFVQVMERTAAAVHRLSADHAGRDIVAVTHGGTIRAALALALGLEPERALAFTVENCSLTRIDHIAGAASSEHDPETGVWRVSQVNLPADNPIRLPQAAYGFGRRA